jgi:hypothetical protein
LIGKEHGKIVTQVSATMKIKTFMLITFVVSVLLSTVKYFRYRENKTDIIYNSWFLNVNNDYPMKSSTLDEFRFTNKHTFSVDNWCFMVFNCLCDLLNYPLFLVVNLILDINTAVELKKTLSKKIVIPNETKEKEEKRKKENEEAINRMIAMVVLNAMSNLFLKSFATVNSFFDLYNSLLFRYDYKLNFQQNHSTQSRIVYFCQQLKGCDMLEEVSNLTYYVSLSLAILFYYNFDRIFKMNFRKLIDKDSVQRNKNKKIKK